VRYSRSPTEIESAAQGFDLAKTSGLTQSTNTQLVSIRQTHQLFLQLSLTNKAVKTRQFIID